MTNNKPLTRYVKFRVAHAPGMPGTFSPPPRDSDPDIQYGTCLTHVPWCMPGPLTSDFLWKRWRGKRSRHSRRMRNPQFFVSGKRPIACLTWGLHNSEEELSACKRLYNITYWRLNKNGRHFQQPFSKSSSGIFTQFHRIIFLSIYIVNGSAFDQWMTWRLLGAPSSPKIVLPISMMPYGVISELNRLLTNLVLWIFGYW